MVTEHEPIIEDNAYLVRNRLAIAEFRDKKVPLVCGSIVGRSDRYLFYSAGVVDSTVFGKPIYVGIKRSTSERPRLRDDLTRIRFVNELAIISAISHNFPDLTEKLPLFYGLLVDRQGLAAGIVTEDFSEGGLQRVRAGGASPLEVKRLFVEGSVDNDYIQNCAYTVNGRTRLGDFWYFWRHEDREENAKRVGADWIQQRLADFTLEVDLEF